MKVLIAETFDTDPIMVDSDPVAVEQEHTKTFMTMGELAAQGSCPIEFIKPETQEIPLRGFTMTPSPENANKRLDLPYLGPGNLTRY